MCNLVSASFLFQLGIKMQFVPITKKQELGCLSTTDDSAYIICFIVGMQPIK